MATDDEFLAELGAALAPADREPPADRIAALRAAVAARAAAGGPLATTDQAEGLSPSAGLSASAGGPAPATSTSSPDERHVDAVGVRRAARPGRRAYQRGRIAAVVVGVAAAVGAIVVGATLVGDDGPAREDLLAGGTVEFETVLRGPDGEATAGATGIVTGIGRTVQLRTDDLAILPTGEFYELWFVGPGDSPRSPNRISAGTFHPDEAGRSRVDLTAAVNPALYPELSVTAEPGDGDPRATGPEVLRADIELLDS